jgi:glycosyltransferase involved in cell wall biosynthesis|uniref:Glycosyl transferase family 1 domain-containing protein n=1 Tax=viral metagenome TaxID=1070528 RepID=A0A6C0BH79_9ZZZZ
MTDLSSFVKELNEIINQPSSIAVPEPVVNAPVASISSVPSISSEKKVKILLVSTHVNQVNGYSKVMYNIIKQLAQPWIQLVHFATQKLMGAEIGRHYPKGVKVIDATALDKEKQPGFALSELPNTILSEKPDVVFIYNDLSVICAYIEEIRKVISRRTFKIWAYVDVTYVSPPQGTIDILNRDVERIFCFTKSWKDSITSQGITRPVDVMNHGVDTSLFRSIPKELARQTLGLPKDIFLFTSLNRNIPRKRLDLLVMSFVTLIVRFPTKPIFLLMVADKGDRGGFQLFDIFARELKLNNATVEMFGNRLMLTSKDTCYRDEDINMLYNCADAGISCAEGEGFGLCTFEQMSVGVPQIVPEINGYTEYCTSENSLLVKPSMRYYIPQVYHSVPGEAQMVDPNVVAKTMERYVFDEALRKQHGKLAKEKASSYTWEKCVAIMMKRLRLLQEEED